MAYEDTSAFTEVDDGDCINKDIVSVVSQMFDWTDVTGYVCKDYGAAHFSGDFAHLFEIQYGNNGSNSYGYLYGLSNSIKDLRQSQTDNEDSLALLLWDNDRDLYLRLVESGVVNQDSYQNTPADRRLWTTIDRVDETNVYTGIFRTVSHGGPIQDTLVITGAAPYDFQHLYALSSADTNGGRSGITYTLTQHLDLQEAAVPRRPWLIYY